MSAMPHQEVSSPTDMLSLLTGPRPRPTSATSTGLINETGVGK